MTDRIAPVALLIGALILVSAPSGAETYRWVDEQGNVTYSDRPPQPREIRTPAPDAMPTPDVKAPEPKAPDVKASDMKTFDVKVPEVKAPEVKAPEVKTSDVRTPPEMKTPEMKAGPTKIDELLQLAGVRAQLVGLLSRVTVDLRPPPGQMSPADQAIIDRILAQSLRHETVYTPFGSAGRSEATSR